MHSKEKEVKKRLIFSYYHLSISYISIIQQKPILTVNKNSTKKKQLLAVAKLVIKN